MIFAVVGMPLSGKTTLIESVRKEIDIPVLSSGDVARELGMKYEKSIKSNDISMDLNDAIIERVLTFINSNENCILDGFPRSEEQIKLLQSYDVEIIFVQSNMVNIYTRALRRNRDKNDEYAVVIGRCEASMKLKQNLHQYYNNVNVFESDEHFDENASLLIEYIKEKI